jgi:RNA binding activity-knot of a chromodomain
VLSDGISESPAEAGSASASEPQARYIKGDLVMVEWQGKWWAASVLDAKDARYLIHYDGYDASWDEWVTTARMKKR